MPQDNKLLTVVILTDEHGHWIEWKNDGETGTLGPYEDMAMAEHVRTAKEREFRENQRHIDDV